MSIDKTSAEDVFLHKSNGTNKTRTGKIVRRVIRAKALGERLGSQDLSIIENPQSLKNILAYFN